jgi:hypothetical protein
MRLFNLFKKSDSRKENVDEYLRGVEIIDVIGPSDNPVITISGIKKRSPANIFFKDFARSAPRRIDSFIKDSDSIFWIFDGFFVLEVYASDDDKKLFVVMTFTASEFESVGHDGLDELLLTKEVPLRILRLKEELSVPTVELKVFMEAWNLLVQNQDKIISILQKKYQ